MLASRLLQLSYRELGERQQLSLCRLCQEEPGVVARKATCGEFWSLAHWSDWVGACPGLPGTIRRRAGGRFRSAHRAVTAVDSGCLRAARLHTIAADLRS